VAVDDDLAAGPRAAGAVDLEDPVVDPPVEIRIARVERFADSLADAIGERNEFRLDHVF
jgi:hypothetical protein